MFKLSLVAEFNDANTRAEAEAALDAFREAVVPSANYGLALYAADERTSGNKRGTAHVAAAILGVCAEDALGGSEPARGQRVAPSDKLITRRRPPATGVVVGVRQFCRLDGCGSRRLIVRWPDGKRTEPCLRGCEWDRRAQCWRIL